jgi:hypothetical protein
MHQKAKDLMSKFQEKTDCAGGTCRTYAYSMKFMQDGMEGETWKDTTKALAFLKDKPLSRRQNCITALKVWFRSVDPNEESCQRLGEPLKCCFKEGCKKRERQLKSEGQKKNWLHLPCLRKEIRDMKTSVFQLPKSEIWGKADYHKAQLALFMEYMTRHPCRRDLASLKYGVSEGNYVDDSMRAFRFNLFKTRKHKDETVVRLSRDLWKLLQRIRKQHRLRGIATNSVFLNSYWGPMQRESLGGYLSRKCTAYLPCCREKHITCNLLRHIFVSWKKRGEMKLADQRSMARNMMHSTKEAQLYRVTDP